jgi:hypothetical protein
MIGKVFSSLKNLNHLNQDRKRFEIKIQAQGRRNQYAPIFQYNRKKTNNYKKAK